MQNNPLPPPVIPTILTPNSDVSVGGSEDNPSTNNPTQNPSTPQNQISDAPAFIPTPPPLEPPTPEQNPTQVPPTPATNQFVPAGLAQDAPGGSAPNIPTPIFNIGNNLASTPKTAPLAGLNNSDPLPPPPPPPPPPIITNLGSNIQENPGLGESGDKPKIIGGSGFFSDLKNNPKKLILFGLAGLTLLAVLALVISNLFGGNRTTSVNTTNTSSPNNPPTNQQNSGASTTQTNRTGDEVVISYWGLWEQSEILEGVIKEYEAKNPGVKIDYRKQSHVDYRERLQTAVATGNGPDIFRYHATWTSMLSNELSPLPSRVMTADEFQQIFYPVAFRQLQHNGQIMGIPLMYDSLGLYYNKEVLRTAGLQPPKTWAELKKMANDLTVPSNKNDRGQNIQRSGLAIGNASNVDHYADILALLILQNGGSPNQPNTQEVSDALTFYTNFVKTDRVWNDALPNSTVAFARGDVAMMFAPSWRVHEIKAINPELDFGITTVPRLGDEVITWSNYWVEGVNNKSRNKDQAWDFLKYMSSKEVLQKFYSSASQARAFGEIYPRQDMASELINNELVAPFLADAPYGRGWHMNNHTHDNGANDLTIKYYADAINAMLGGKSSREVLETLEQGVFQVMRQYGE